MQLNPTTVKSLRQTHNWTQQHLADACDVSLRTIQRVENQGAASRETTMSLCAVLEVRQGELIKLDEVQVGNTKLQNKPSKFLLAIAVTAFISFVAGVASVLLIIK